MSDPVLVEATKIVVDAQHRHNRRQQLWTVAAIAALCAYMVLWVAGLAGFAYWMWTLAQ